MTSKKCVICCTSANNVLDLGEMKTYKKITAHYYCLLLASTIKQSGEDEEGILGFLPSDIKNEIKLSQNRVCVYCKRKGASVLCSRKSCKTVFHLPCGIKNQSGHQFYGNFISHCRLHRPRQRFNIPTETQTCPICYDKINFTTWKVLWAPCCKKQSFFHKKCIQQMALSAGYFFKCPMCNDCALFQKTMKHYGVFIPDRDASWELEPNAFQELLYRHTECNVKVCLCKNGRNYDNLGQWNIVLCSMCGSQGTHLNCSKLKKNQEWICELCVIDKKTDSQMNGGNSVNGDLLQPSTSNSNTEPIQLPQIQNNVDTSSTPQSKPNKRKRNRSLRSSTTIKHDSSLIEIDSEDSDVVVIEDEPNTKCLIAQDRSLLKVHKSIMQQQYKNKEDIDIENQDSSSCTEFMNLVITDVRSLSESQNNFIENKRPNSMPPINVIDVTSDEFKNIHNRIMSAVTEQKQQQQQNREQQFLVLQEMVYDNNNISIHQESSSNQRLGNTNSSSSDDIVVID